MISGRAMQRHLVELGIPVQKVVRKRESGDYIAEFFVAGMQQPVQPAQNWAWAIRQALPHATILQTHDTVARWRSENPVIHARVTFRI